MVSLKNTHSKWMGYALWIFGFTGAHRFYYGKPWSGTLYFLTLGLLGIGWLVDFFLIPSMDREADFRFIDGPYQYSFAWILLTFFGYLGLHRFYLGRWKTGLVYLFTGGIFFMGIIYDFWCMNDLVAEANTKAARF